MPPMANEKMHKAYYKKGDLIHPYKQKMNQK
jgi:hypothetical protein